MLLLGGNLNSWFIIRQKSMLDAREEFSSVQNQDNLISIAYSEKAKLDITFKSIDFLLKVGDSSF